MSFDGTSCLEAEDLVVFFRRPSICFYLTLGFIPWALRFHTFGGVYDICRGPEPGGTMKTSPTWVQTYRRFSNLIDFLIKL